MPNLPECYGIIPARYASTRFPGKPLAEIHGRPMFWHVYTRARQCAALTRVLVATDDERIRAAARTLEVETMLTRSDHPSGTDRVLEAAERLQVPHDAIVVNIQGDEPAMDPCMLTELLAPFEDPAVAVTTLASPIDASAAQEPDRVKVVLAANGQALYFSRARIPYPRDPAASAYYGHIGLYAFRMHVLREFVKLPPSRLETSEKLEQLRLLENGIPIRVVLTRHQSIGVDRPEDLARVSRLMASGQC